MTDQKNPTEEKASCCSESEQGKGEGAPCCPMMEMCQKCMSSPMCRFGYIVMGLLLIACGVLVLIFPQILAWLLGIAFILMGVMALVCGSMMHKMCGEMMASCGKG
ncbi:MAG: hypothetical protein ACYTGQ_10595 [Planctomycetota bacterium]|jgi:hypothetical protein